MVELIFKRFTLNQRIQHILFFISFILLAYTGFPLKFPESWWSSWMIASVGGFDNRTFIHHYSGLVMIIVSLYHVVFHIIFEKPRFDVLFNLNDFRDFAQQIKYYLRLSDKHPKYGRYTFKQKVEYFGAGFGAVVMGFSGLLMWQPFETMRFLPIGVIQIAGLFHTWEAVLASIAVFIGHFYDEHFDKFLNLSWLTGNIPEEEMKLEHPLEYEEEMKNRPAGNAEHVEHKKNKSLIMGLGMIVFTIFFIAICLWLVWMSYTILLEAIENYIL
jgi:formate dehydrogenase subunit gamma